MATVPKRQTTPTKRYTNWARNATLLDRGFDLRGRDDFVSELRGYNTRWFPCYAGDNRPINVHK